MRSRIVSGRMARAITILALFLTSGLFLGPSYPQVERVPTPEIQSLARSLAATLAASDIKTIAVFDLRTPDRNWLPFGSWLGDQVSAALANAGVTVVHKSQLLAAMSRQHVSPRDSFGSITEARIAASLGAEAFVVGTFGELQGQIGITLVATRVSAVKPGEPIKLLTLINDKVPSEDLAQHLGVPLDSLRPGDGVYKAGIAGLTVPKCESCPPPHFSPGALVRKGQGTIVLSIVVSPEGQPREVKIIRSVDAQIDEEAIKAVEDYRFKPALDPDGHPIAARMPYTLSFRLAQ